MLFNCGVAEDSLRVPWTARRSNQSILNEISPECSLEGFMLKLKLQYFSLLMWRDDSLEKILMLGKIEGRRKRGWQRIRWLHGITDSMDMSLSKIQEIVKDSKAWQCCSPGGYRVQNDWATEQQQGVDLKISNHKKKIVTRVVWTVTKLIAVTILQYIQISNHYIVHLKLICQLETVFFQKRH